MFAPDHQFLTTLARLFRTLPIFSLFSQSMSTMSRRRSPVLSAVRRCRPSLLRAWRPSVLHLCGAPPEHHRPDRRASPSSAGTVRVVAHYSSRVRDHVGRHPHAQPGRAHASRQRGVPGTAPARGT
jgi:hypothetical protein